VIATKKSAATMALAWLQTNVRQCCEDVLLPPLGSICCRQYAAGRGQFTSASLAKVAPFHVRMHFLRSTGPLEQQGKCRCTALEECGKKMFERQCAERLS
jgi:hypothetical protein